MRVIQERGGVSRTGKDQLEVPWNAQVLQRSRIPPVWPLSLEVRIDSAAAAVIAVRRGVGAVWHLATGGLWAPTGSSIKMFLFVNELDGRPTLEIWKARRQGDAPQTSGHREKEVIFKGDLSLCRRPCLGAKKVGEVGLWSAQVVSTSAPAQPPVFFFSLLVS